MGRNEIPIARVELPANWTPEGVTCAIVPIPDDPEFFAQLIGLIDQLRHSATFARDETKTGASTVARTWTAALATRPIAIMECEDVMAKFDIRINPSNPCQMQASTDGGLTWHLALDLGCAKGNVVTPPPTDDGKAGELAAVYIRYIVIEILNRYQETEVFNTFATNVIALFEPYGVNPELLKGQLGTLWNAGDDRDTMPDVTDDCTYECFYIELREYIADNPLTWLDNLAAWLANWLNCTAYNMMTALNQTAAWIGSEVLGAYMTTRQVDGGGAGFGSACPQEPRCDDFTESMAGWTITGYGDYVGGSEAFIGTLNPETNWYQIDITGNNPPFGFIGQLRVDWGCSSGGNGIEIYIDGELVSDVEGGSAGARTEIIPVAGVINSVRIKCEQDLLNLGPHVYSVCYEEEE